jgi:hypothetical protein
VSELFCNLHGVLKLLISGRFGHFLRIISIEPWKALRLIVAIQKQDCKTVLSFGVSPASIIPGLDFDINFGRRRFQKLPIA